MLHGASFVANARTPIHGAAAEDALLTEPDDGGHAQLASTATASIFKRSALLSNMLSAKALVHCGAIGSNSGCSSAKRPRATAHDFGQLSALALASERAPCKTDAIIVDGHFLSGLLGHTDGAKPCDVASSSSADFIQGLAHAFADDAGNSQLVPGWVPGAPPQGEQPEHHGVVPPSPPGAIPSARTCSAVHEDDAASRPVKAPATAP